LQGNAENRYFFDVKNPENKFSFSVSKIVFLKHSSCEEDI